MTDRTLDVVFSRFKWNSFTRTLRQEPSGVSRIRRRITRLRDVCSTPTARNSTGLPQGYCVRVSSKSRKYDILCPICYFNVSMGKANCVTGSVNEILSGSLFKKVVNVFKLTFYPLFKKKQLHYNVIQRLQVLKYKSMRIFLIIS